MKEKEKMSNFRIPEKALEKIKSQSELDDFFSDLYKQAVEGMLKAELDDHLGYEKHQVRERPGNNSRNGFSKKTLKTNIGDIPLDVPRDRESSFDPVILRLQIIALYFKHLLQIIALYFKHLLFILVVN